MEHFPVDPELRRDAWTVVLDEQVGVLHELVQNLLALTFLEIKRDRSLASVDRDERAGEPYPEIVPTVGRLDLDHVGAEERQLVGAERTCVRVRQVHDADAVEQPLHQPGWGGGEGAPGRPLRIRRSSLGGDEYGRW